jgi:Spy/CpxP family protein refolding chaperone
MKKMIITLGLAVVMLLGVTYVYAQGPGMGPGHRGMHESWGPGKDSPLSPEQKTKFQELRRTFREENAKLIGAMVTKRLELQSLWTNPKAESKAILDKEKELRDLQNQLRDKGIQMKLEARKFLTPEQIANFGPGCGMGTGFGGGHKKGYGPGAGRGYRMME